MEKLDCKECHKTHYDSDEVEVVSDGHAISVVCKTHAVWANRKILAALRDSWKLSPVNKKIMGD